MEEELGKPEASFEEACRDVATQIAETVISKQHDYGHQNILAFREKGLVVRLTDKMARLTNTDLHNEIKLEQVGSCPTKQMEVILLSRRCINFIRVSDEAP